MFNRGFKLILYIQTELPTARTILDMSNLVYRSKPSDYVHLRMLMGTREMSETDRARILEILKASASQPMPPSQLEFGHQNHYKR